MLSEEFNRLSSSSAPGLKAAMATIMAERSDLTGADPEIARCGQSFTFIFDQEVVKVPFYSLDEVEILRRLPELSLNIPQITYVSRTNDFYAMARLDGITLRAALPEMTRSQATAAAEDLAAFKIDLEQRVSLDVINSLDKVRSDERDASDHILQTIEIMNKKDVKDILQGELKAYDRLMNYFDRVTARNPVLTHNDLNMGNILVDPETMRLSNVLDFGNAEKRMVPEAELSKIYLHYDRSFFETFKSAYFSAHPTITREDYNCYCLSSHLRNAFHHSNTNKHEQLLHELPQKLQVYLPKAGM